MENAVVFGSLDVTRYKFQNQPFDLDAFFIFSVTQCFRELHLIEVKMMKQYNTFSFLEKMPVSIDFIEN